MTRIEEIIATKLHGVITDVLVVSDDRVEFTDDDDKRYYILVTPVPAKLSDYDLVPLDAIRFRDKAGANWKEGQVKDINEDGSVWIIQTSNKASRSIHPEHIEKKGTGKRGGSTWKSITPT